MGLADIQDVLRDANEAAREIRRLRAANATAANDALERAAEVARNWKRKKLGRDLSKATYDPCGRWDGGEVYEDGRERDLIAAAIRALKTKEGA